jgi:hypothetical protein
MVRLHEDVDGCGCVRCQDIDHDVVQRSLAGALFWSVSLPFNRPSILVALVAVGAIQAVAVVAPTELGLVFICGGVLGVFGVRGYIGVLGRTSLGSGSPTPVSALGTVIARFPSFLGAMAAIVLGLVTIGLMIVSLLAPALTGLVLFAGFDSTVAEYGTVLLLATVLMSALLKFVFVPEACFVGGYGPLGAIRVSWRVSRVHTSKVIVIVTGFVVLLLGGVLLETQLGGSGAPVALEVNLGETTVVLRSFGLSVSSRLRFLFDTTITALYSGVFVHQYVSGTLTVDTS